MENIEYTEEIAQTEVSVGNENAGGEKKKFTLRGAVKTLSPDASLILFGVFTVLMIAIRAYQLMYIFEPDTGFYFIEQKNHFTIPLLYAVAVISFAIYLIVSYISGKTPEGKAPAGKNYYLATASVVFAVTLVADAMLCFSKVFNLYDSAIYPTFKQFLSETKSAPIIMEVVCALLAALYFIIVAVSYFTGNQAFKSSKVLSVAPVCWCIFRLIGRFIRAESFIHTSELFWEMAAATFLMLFFLEFARIMSDVDGKNKLNIAVGFGLCGAASAFMLFFSRIIAYVFAGDAYITESSPIEFCDFGAALLVVIFLLSCVHDLTVRVHAQESAPAAEPTQEAPKQPLKPSDEEVFRIADEYSNRYLRDEPINIDYGTNPEN
ncbi:MAG: hypothetical protein IJ766_03505 [Clostridia bacterium]|nr:hypothetical protein [Clostridia bacterium]